MPFENNNSLSGIPTNSLFQVGQSNVDSNFSAEKGVTIPTFNDAAVTWVYFECTVGSMLDSTIKPKYEHRYTKV